MANSGILLLIYGDGTSNLWLYRKVCPLGFLLVSNPVLLGFNLKLTTGSWEGRQRSS